MDGFLLVLCCVKQVPDVDQMRMDPETGNLIRAGVPAILNPQDANALSAAMKVKETYGGEVTLITMGPPNAEAALRECLAVGADKAVLVTDRAFGNADTLATSYSILSAASTQDKYDMIFCGKESLDGATGQMGAQLAQRFEAAQVTGTLLIKEVNEEAKTAVVERELEDGVETLEVQLPCLFTMEKTNYSDMSKRIENRYELVDIIQAWLSKYENASEAIEILRSHDVPCAEVKADWEMHECPQLASRHYFEDIPFPKSIVEETGRKQYKIKGLPFKTSSDAENPDYLPLPEVGEHNYDVYGTVATKEEIDALLDRWHNKFHKY